MKETSAELFPIQHLPLSVIRHISILCRIARCPASYSASSTGQSCSQPLSVLTGCRSSLSKPIANKANSDLNHSLHEPIFEGGVR